MSKSKPCLGLFKRTVHDGSVSYSVLMPNPRDGLGESTKTHEQRVRRHMFYGMAHKYPMQARMFLAMYRKEI